MKALSLVTLLFVGLLNLSKMEESPKILTIDSVGSEVMIHVGKAGFFRFAGHTHEVAASRIRGSLNLNRENPARSNVHLEIDTSSLTVTGRGEPAGDVAEVQRVMHSEDVLDVEKFPTITFVSRGIEIIRASTGSLELVVVGDLTIHGVTRLQRVRSLVEFGSDGLTAMGRMKINQTDFEIDPIRAAGGTVKVKNELEINFSIRATL